jgi:glycerate kinase
MTAETVKERLRAVEEKQDATVEKLDYLIERFDKFVEQSEQRFITRLEGKVAVGTISLVIAVLAFWFSHFGNSK